MDNIKDVLAQRFDKLEAKVNFKQVVEAAITFPPTKAFIEQHADAINQQMIENSLSKFHEFKREYQIYQNHGIGANPGFMPELFINEGYIDVRYIPTPELMAQKKRLAQEKLITNDTMSRDVRMASLENYYLNTSQRKFLFSKVMDFIESYLKVPYRSKGLYIHGPFGVGKTYLMGALANDLITHNIRVHLIHYPTFTLEVKKAISENSHHDMIDQLKRVDILMLDDIGAELNSPWIRDEILNPLLEYRMKEALATFFTSNFDMNGLEKHLAYTKDGGQENVKARRIMERVKFLSEEVFLPGESLR